mmetsp:Transcript_7079/g.14181  ORF Transcript_7079/g.14181 Transcript_7079/m.14181 type:complete len:134 (-) Transcript_7079:262-663(-)
METIWKILIASGAVSLAIFLQVLSCFAFDNNWLPLIILVPMLLTPVPMVLLNMCSSGSGDMFSEKSAGTHWAEFASAFFFTGCVAIPVLLAITDSIDVGAALTSLAGTLILLGLWGWCVYLNRKDSQSFSAGI